LPEATKRKPPKGPQQYKGSEHHTWEEIGPDYTGASRLRVPGGWLYEIAYEDGDVAVVFVPVPEVVGYKV
jgi:hypothetical protein